MLRDGRDVGADHLLQLAHAALAARQLLHNEQPGRVPEGLHDLRPRLEAGGVGDVESGYDSHSLAILPNCQRRVNPSRIGATSVPIGARLPYLVILD